MSSDPVLERATRVGDAWVTHGTPIRLLGNLTVVKATAQNTADEAFWVLEGALTVRRDAETCRAGAGSYVFLPGGVPHTFRVDGNAPARMLTLLTPGGGEAFFVVGGRPAERATLAPEAPPDLPRLQRVAHKFGSEFVGPPLPPAAATLPAG